MKKAQLEAAYNKQQKEIAQLKDFVARNKARVATRNMAMSRQKKLDKMDIIELAKEKPKPEFHFKEARAAGKVIFGFSFGTDFIILIAWSDLLQNTAKNTGWKNHGKIQKRTAAGGLPAGTGNVCGAALQLPASRKSRQLYGSDAGHRGGQR